MQSYTMMFGHDDVGAPGRKTLCAATEQDAIAQTRKFVAAGYRNGTWATLDFDDGRAYTARNDHGQAVGQMV